MGTAVAGALSSAGLRPASFVGERSELTQRRAAEAGVAVYPTLTELLAEVSLVISLVPQQSVVETAREFAKAAAELTDASHRASLVYLDANSVSPATMRVVAGVIEGVGAACVDGAFLGSAGDLGSRTRLYLSGEQAVWVAGVVEDALPVQVLNGPIGQASGFKLAFSGFNKGLVALFLETMAGGFRAGAMDELFKTLMQFYPSTLETIERLLPSYPTHAFRRAAEMAERTDWLREVGQNTLLAEAVQFVIADFASREPGTAGSDSLAMLEEVAERGFLAADGARAPTDR